MTLKSKEKIEMTVKSLDDKLKLGLDQVGNQIAVLYGDGNPETHHIKARSFRRLIIKEGKELGYIHTGREIESIQEMLGDLAEASDNELQVYLRVASIDGGIELDVGDKKQTRIRLTAGNVEVISEGSDVLFYRPEALQPFVIPAEEGFKYGLFEYLNLDPIHAWLLIVWICYVLSTPRSDVNSYPILVLIAEQGAAKSTTCANYS